MESFVYQLSVGCASRWSLLREQDLSYSFCKNHWSWMTALGRCLSLDYVEKSSKNAATQHFPECRAMSPVWLPHCVGTRNFIPRVLILWCQGRAKYLRESPPPPPQWWRPSVHHVLKKQETWLPNHWKGLSNTRALDAFPAAPELSWSPTHLCWAGVSATGILVSLSLSLSP